MQVPWELRGGIFNKDFRVLKESLLLKAQEEMDGTLNFK
jgi:hypothetical protein